MNPASTPPRVVPTLTEVLVETELELESSREGLSTASTESNQDFHTNAVNAGVEPEETEPPAEDLHSVDAGVSVAMQDAIARQVWQDLQAQVDRVVDYRLRETLAPILSRIGDQLIQEARNELALTLKDVVTRAVAQELARQRLRQGTGDGVVDAMVAGKA